MIILAISSGGAIVDSGMREYGTQDTNTVPRVLDAEALEGLY